MKQGIEQLEEKIYFDFNHFGHSDFPSRVIQSPEDMVDLHRQSFIVQMSKARNLDVFYDVVFELQTDTKNPELSQTSAQLPLMRANSAILKARSKYFQNMLS